MKEVHDIVRKIEEDKAGLFGGMHSVWAHLVATDEDQ